MKIWLDDIRKPPNGWLYFKTVPELIKFYERNHNEIKIISLDHDLGEDTPTGYKFITWLEEKIFNGVYNKIPEIKVHSDNPVGRKKMEHAIIQIEKKLHGKI